MTSVAGHITDLRFGEGFEDWKFPPPIRLFDAPVFTVISDKVVIN